jgi:hypothetical protein
MNVLNSLIITKARINIERYILRKVKVILSR